MSKYVYNDGGREAAGKRGQNDCVTRAIALATGRKYTTVYRWMQRDMKDWYSRQGLSESTVARYSNPGRGISPGHYVPYLRERGWYRDRITQAVYTDGWTVSDAANYFKDETVIVSCKRPKQRTRGHLCCIKKGTVLDTWDCREALVVAVYRKRPKQ